LGSSTASERPLPVFVITGTSGAGKGTLERELIARMPELELAVSATTRERRANERDGREYWFISETEFDEKIERGDFLEWVELEWGPRSGTLHSEIERIQTAGRIPVLDLETEGAARIKRRVPGAVTIFVKTPSFAENERRLRARATEDETEIATRLDVARAQLEQADEFDHVVVNDDLERAVSALVDIIRGEMRRVGTLLQP
jgi:guanylate kinase